MTSCSTSSSRTLPYLENGKPILDRLDERRSEQLRAAMPGLKERAKTLVELADGAAFLFAERPLVDRRQGGGAARRRPRKDILAGAHAALKAVDGDWNAASAEAAIREFAGAQRPEARRGRAAVARRADGKTAPRRACSTCWRCLARDESLARIGDQID